MTTEKQDERALVVMHQEIERRDDQQIVEFMLGGVVDEYVYAFKDKSGRMQVGLSWAGTREMAQGRGNIKIEEEPHITEHEDHWRGMALAQDMERNVALWGGCHVPKKMMIHVYGPNGEDTGEVKYIDDPFAYEKCVAKCQRNALKAIMPVTSVTRFIIHYCEANDIRLPEKLRKVQQRQRPAKSSVAAEGAKAGAQTAAPAAQATSNEAPAGMCPIHNVSFIKGQYGPYHRLPDGVACKGGTKAKKAQPEQPPLENIPS